MPIIAECSVPHCPYVVMVRCDGCGQWICQEHTRVTTPYHLGGTAICPDCFDDVLSGETPARLEAAMNRTEPRKDGLYLAPF